MLRILKESSCLGATISNIDLSQTISTNDKETIKKALAKYEVLFFRNQDIAPNKHKEFALIFGSLQSHPVYPTVKGFPEITILENLAVKIPINMYVI